MTYAQERVNPYGQNGAKGDIVRQMFDHIAPTYDRLNHRLSWSIDRLWRRKAVRALRDSHPKTILDIATGTADLAILAAKTLLPERVVAADISEKMMEIGQQKVAEAGLSEVITFAREDCMHLSFDDNTFDAVTSAFGLRNFQDLDTCLKEVYRVLRKGGRLSAVELTTPIHFPMKQLFNIYSSRVIPLYGQTVAGDRGAYEYLTHSVEAFPQGDEMRKALRKAGFSLATFERMTGGICTRYMALK